MKNALVVFVAVLLVGVLSVPVEAAEAYLGTIVNSDAGTGTSTPSNLTTATPFVIQPLALITVQPNAAAYVCVGARGNMDAGILLSDGGLDYWTQYVLPTCSSSIGVKVAADTAFPTSCGNTGAWTMPDGGITSCVVSVVPVSGASVTSVVWSRNGKEF